MNWREFKFFDRTYEVSDKGHVKNDHGRILKGTMHPNGFRIINTKIIHSNGRTSNKGFMIHRLVAKCWVDNPEFKPYVIHKDGNLLNNAAKNLAWATPKEKIAHQKQLGRHGMAKLTTRDVFHIKSMINKKEKSINEIAREYNVSHTQIHRIKRGENWNWDIL